MACASPDRRPARLARARYRARQFLRGFRPHLAPSEIADVRALLSERELALFLAADARDRRHSVDLLRRLQCEASESGRPLPREMQVAALLHDVGKGPLLAWHRVAFVLLSHSRRLAARVEAADGAAWRRALWRLRHHARLGAEQLREAGSNPRVIVIVAAHTIRPPADDAELRWFIQADDRV